MKRAKAINFLSAFTFSPKKGFLQFSLVFLMLFSMNLGALAQGGGPPPPPGGHGDETDQKPLDEGPVGSGIVLLLALGAAYGAKKVYNARSLPDK